MHKLLVISDWDHCLFRSEEFWEAVTDLLEREYGANHNLSAGKFRQERLDRSPTGPGRLANGEGYDFFAHLAKYDVDADEAERAIVDQLRGDGWLYPGAVDMINGFQARGYTFVIETTGADRFQRVKIACAANLPEGIPVRALPGNKGDVLHDEWQKAGGVVHRGIRYSHVIVIDNAASTFQALGKHRGLTAIQVTDREKSPEPSPLEWVHKVKELTEIPALLS